MEFPTRVIALKRFGRMMSRQAADALYFSPAGLELRAGGKALESWPYKQVEGIDYHAFPRSGSGVLQALGGNFFLPNEARWIIDTGDGKREFYSENNHAYRENELVDLFRALYEKGVKLREFSSDGRRLYLLEVTAVEEIVQRIVALREGEG